MKSLVLASLASSDFHLTPKTIIDLAEIFPMETPERIAEIRAAWTEAGILADAPPESVAAGRIADLEKALAQARDERDAHARDLGAFDADLAKARGEARAALAQADAWRDAMEAAQRDVKAREDDLDRLRRAASDSLAAAGDRLAEAARKLTETEAERDAFQAQASELGERLAALQPEAGK